MGQPITDPTLTFDFDFDPDPDPDPELDNFIEIMRKHVLTKHILRGSGKH